MLCLLLLSGFLAAPDAPVVTSPVEMVAAGFQFTEGPLWTRDTGLVFSDIPADTIYRADKSVFRKPSGNSNGLTCDREGRLIVCEHGNRRVSRTEKDGTVTTLADRYLGRRLNSPNDVVARSDGRIFFTDPPYGVKSEERELPFCGVYVIASDGTVTLLSVYFRSPNGLAFSPDEKTLYIGDSAEDFIEAFDVAEDGSLGNARLFAKAPTPDGMKIDSRGQLWVAAKDGVRVFSPEGRLIATVAVPEQPANCAFGDPDRQTLYVTARNGVYKVRCA
ncbi:MAG: SMP-30/gluconolactonase/LRE family protein, partial [Candidatus Hydrogenedentes bacterium]|nr:SMP-30/gluconolactonase/LRE family protein [Candidatus Hydrogenedentota bacterium]